MLHVSKNCKKGILKLSHHKEMINVSGNGYFQSDLNTVRFIYIYIYIYIYQKLNGCSIIMCNFLLFLCIS
jgi:hypothetical protein